VNEFKQANGVLKFICGLAAAVFLFAPITTKHGLEVGGGALLVLILCAGVHAGAKRDKDKNSE
jgi:hypothetical protein